MRTPLPMALFGAGTIGAHHARVIAESGNAELVAVVDTDIRRAEALTARFGGKAVREIGDADPFRAAVVATPTHTHRAIAGTLLDRDIPVLVEKPLSDDVEETRGVLDLSERRSVPLICGFVERFNPVITTALGLIEDDPIHVVCIRHSPPAPRVRTSVVYDLLIHDIDLALRACGRPRQLVSATGWKPDPSEVLEIVDATIAFDPPCVATLSSDRHGQRKVRSVAISTRKSLLELDLVRQTITVYRHVSHELRADQPTYRAETMMEIPFIRHAGEPLALQLKHFLALIEGKADAKAERETLLAPHTLAAEVEARATEW